MLVDHSFMLWYVFVPSVLISLVYSALIIRFFWNFTTCIKEPAPNNQSAFPGISVVIAFRNEAANLSQLLKSLGDLSYPNAEYILVDDHSRDSSRAIVNNLNEVSSQVRLLTNTGSGKKSAIEAGIHASTKEYVVLTDADCLVPSTWLLAIGQFLAARKPYLLIMPVSTLKSASWFGKFQELDFLSLIASTFGAGTRPFLCNGANLCVNRAVFMELNPFEGNRHIPTGDDIFLLQAVNRTYPEKVELYAKPAVCVQTSVKSTFNGFFEQRIRWGSKTINYQDWYSVFVAGLVFLQSAIILATGLLVLLTSYPVANFLVVLMVKIAVDSLLLIKAAYYFKKLYLIPLILPASLVYVMYVPIVAIVGVLRNLFNFKK